MNGPSYSDLPHVSRIQYRLLDGYIIASFINRFVSSGKVMISAHLVVFMTSIKSNDKHFAIEAQTMQISNET